MTKPRSSWLVPVGLVVASWGLGLVAMWFAVTEGLTTDPPRQPSTTLLALPSSTTTGATTTTLTSTTVTQSTTVQPTSSQPVTTRPAGTSSTGPTPTSATTATPIDIVFDADAEAAISVSTNALRSSLGLPQLGVNAELAVYARNWARHMAETQEFSHSNIGSLTGSWLTVGENLATGTDPAAMFASLVASPAHHRNLVNLAFTHIGVGVAVDPNGTLWLCQVFGGNLPLPTVPPVTLPSLPLSTVTLSRLP